MQVFCTVLNSSYDDDVCSCDEQISVFGTCVSQYPCLKVFVSYVITTSTAQPHPLSNSSNSLSSSAPGNHHLDRRRQRRQSAAASSEASVVNYSATSTIGPSDDVLQLGHLADVVDSGDHYDDVENQLSGLNVSLNSDYLPALISNVSSSASQVTDSRPATTDYQFGADQLGGNGSKLMTSHRVSIDTRQATTEHNSRELTPTATQDVNRSYVAQLYRSWDDSFLVQVTVSTLYFRSFIRVQPSI